MRAPSGCGMVRPADLAKARGMTNVSTSLRRPRVLKAYFKNKEPINILNNNLSKFIEFKLVVETHLTEQPSINTIAEKLALTTNSLYRIVKEYSGTSPKDFLTNRLMIEAQRKLQYSNLSVKELAYELGFNDPDYFSRLFKKCTGKNVSEVLEKRQDLSRE